MPPYRLSQHSMDVVFKLEARQLGAALGRRFGLALPAVVRYFPTEVPVADVHLEQLDSIFELTDESLLHLEFQTAHRRQTLKRFLLYDAYLYDLHERQVHTVVLYGAGVSVARDEIDAGALHYRVHNVLLGQEDGEATYQALRLAVERGRGLSAEQRLDLVFLPLMRHPRPSVLVVRDAVALAQHLPVAQQRQTVAALIGLGHRFLAETELETLLEGLMSTSVGQRLIERGWQRGLEQGREQGLEQGREQGLEQGREQGLEQGREQGLRLAQQAVLRVLARQFAPLPAALEARIAQIHDPHQLEALLEVALSATSVEEVTATLG